MSMNELATSAAPQPVDEIDATTNAVVDAWMPRWVIEYGKNDVAGITIDDHCVVVLVKNWLGEWTPATHIPREVALRLPEFAAQV